MKIIQRQTADSDKRGNSRVKKMLVHVYHSDTVYGEEWDVAQYQTPFGGPFAVFPCGDYLEFDHI